MSIGNGQQLFAVIFILEIVLCCISSSAMFFNKVNAMSLLQNCGIGRKLNEVCHDSELSTKSTLLKVCGFEHVELICHRTSVLRNAIQSTKPVKTGLEAFLCFKLTNGACYKS